MCIIYYLIVFHHCLFSISKILNIFLRLAMNERLHLYVSIILPLTE